MREMKRGNLPGSLFESLIGSLDQGYEISLYIRSGRIVVYHKDDVLSLDLKRDPGQYYFGDVYKNLRVYK